MNCNMFQNSLNSTLCCTGSPFTTGSIAADTSRSGALPVFTGREQDDSPARHAAAPLHIDPPLPETNAQGVQV